MFRRLIELMLSRGLRRTNPVILASIVLAASGYALTAYFVNNAGKNLQETQAHTLNSTLDLVVVQVQQRLSFFDDLLKENAEHLDGSVARSASLSQLCAEYARQATLRGVAYIGFIPNIRPPAGETTETLLCNFDGLRVRHERLDWRAFWAATSVQNESDDMSALWGVSNRQMTEKLGISEAALLAYPVLQSPDVPTVTGWLILLAKSDLFGNKLLESDETDFVRIQAWPPGFAHPVGEIRRPAVNGGQNGSIEAVSDAKNSVSVERTTNINGQPWRFNATFLKSFWDQQIERSIRVIGWGGFILSTALGIILLFLGASIHSVENLLASLRMRLSYKEQFSHDVVANLAEGVYTTDLKGQITFINPKACRLLGYNQDDILYRNDHELFHSVDPKSADVLGDDCRFLAAILRGEIFESDAEHFKAQDGHIFPVAIVASPIIRAFRTIGMVVSFRDVTQEQNAQNEIWWRANFDVLTRLPNRNLFFDRLRQEISRTIRNSEILALLFIDLDGFKTVNDTHGHEAGDALLLAVAERITSCVRESDTVARLGGDEFTVTLVRQMDPLDIERIAEKIRHKISEPVQIGDVLVRVSASIGVAICPIDTAHFDELLSLADNAMYESKRLGKNCVHFSSKHIREEAIERQVVLDELRKAIDATELTFQLQPILRLSDSTITKAEMLVRWNHPERGLISPSKFVEIAERTGAIVQLGDLVFQMGLEWLAANCAHLPQDFQLSINVSPIQFQVNAKKAEEWVEKMGQLGVPPSNVFVEITESALLVNDHNVRANLDYLKSCGVRLALDDFGSGYSSMANLRNFSIDFIKIDQQFVQRMLHEDNERSITEGIVSLAHRLGIFVIAEGVETEGQAAHLKAMGCEYIQGYWVATPMWPEAFAEFMQDNGHGSGVI